MTTEENKALTRRMWETCWNERRLDRSEEFLAPDVVLHVMGEDRAGIDALRTRFWAVVAIGFASRGDEGMAAMPMTPDSMGRIAKFFVDRHQVPLEDAEARLAGFRLVLACGPEVLVSPTLQAAVLTAANAGSRCFPGGVSLYLPLTE